MKKAEIFLVAIILTVAGLLRLPPIAQGFFAFTYDQGRDLLAAKEIVADKNFTLIGPTTGLMGIFYGPWWYYFLALLFLISKNPITITLIFGLIGIVTVGAIYFLTKRITKNSLVSASLATTVAMSQAFNTTSSQIWNPSLVHPLMTVYIFSLYQIFQKATLIWFFVLGLSSGFIFDTEAAFGIMLITSTVAAPFIFKKQFMNKKSLMFFLGIIIVLAPRIIFEIRHDFLMTKTLINWSSEINQNNMNLIQRFISRLDQFFLIFAQTFSQSNKLLAIPLLVLITVSAVTVRKKIGKDKFFKFLILTLFIIYAGFSFYPESVWDYYLIGLPVIFIIIFAILVKHLIMKNKILTYAILLIATVVGFNQRLLSPFSITWQGDGAIYKNQKAVIEDIKEDLKGDYSLHVYTPARFDYPFDYLVWLYHQTGRIDLPKDNQRRLFLIIRDDNSHLYLPTGWYGDKLKDNTRLLDRRRYQGDIIVEKHLVNE